MVTIPVRRHILGPAMLRPRLGARSYGVTSPIARAGDAVLSYGPRSGALVELEAVASRPRYLGGAYRYEQCGPGSSGAPPLPLDVSETPSLPLSPP